ncbi:hypothetical protein B0O99DRAFT_687533 [Bisporella sp. PMI_857]|nr:hypothetical protein B0O99DRAFT_687533 [Bisporella sp. PMI_857]
MLTLLSPNYVPIETTQDDLIIASIAWGWTLGFGFLTTWTALKQTTQIYGRYGASKINSPYVWMIWAEIAVCLAFGIICYLHLLGQLPPSFAFYFSILTLWALQVQFLLQIIINRVSLLMPDKRKSLRLKVGVAVIITAINISVYCIWIPARLQISHSYEYINNIWDRCEKVIYLIVDAFLNWYFIHTVQKRLVARGLKKYEPLVRFNVWIIGFSLAMDVLIIGTMSLKNSFVYMQFHPLAYIVKLNIEMSLAELIARVNRDPSSAQHVIPTASRSEADKRKSGNKTMMTNFEPETRANVKRLSTSGSKSNGDIHGSWAISGSNPFSGRNKQSGESTYSYSDSDNAFEMKNIAEEKNGIMVHTTSEIVVEPAIPNGKGRVVEEDETPLTEEDRARAERDQLDGRQGMGVYTQVWTQK